MILYCVGCGKTHEFQTPNPRSVSPYCGKCALRPEIRSYVDGLRQPQVNQTLAKYYYRTEVNGMVRDVGFQTFEELQAYISLVHPHLLNRYGIVEPEKTHFDEAVGVSNDQYQGWVAGIGVGDPQDDKFVSLKEHTKRLLDEFAAKNDMPEPDYEGPTK